MVDEGYRRGGGENWSFLLGPLQRQSYQFQIFERSITQFL